MKVSIKIPRFTLFKRYLIVCCLCCLSVSYLALDLDVRDKSSDSALEKTARCEITTKTHQSKTLFSPDEIAQMRENISQKSQLPSNLYIIGHRGMGSSSVLVDATPENTLESFKQALMLGADGIEFDVFETKDGQLLVIHDDELWKNVYGADRAGLKFPEYETQSTFRVSKKNLSDILKFSVGHSGQKPPTLIEVCHLIHEATAIRAALGKQPVIMNIDIKNPGVAVKCLECIDKHFGQKSSSPIDFQSVYFTSPNEQALSGLCKKAKYHKQINLVPQITTRQIYGANNIDDQFIVKNRKLCDLDYLRFLKNSIHTNKYTGIDCVLWDVNPLLLQLCEKEELQLHVYTSNFGKIENYNDFIFCVYCISQTVPIFLKTDNIREVIVLLSRNRMSEDCINAAKVAFIDQLPLEKPQSL